MAGSDMKNLSMENLKEALLQLYDFSGEMDIYLLKYSENLTYALEVPGNGPQYVLRLYRPGYHDREELLGELLWLRQLSGDTQIKLAAVVPGNNGELIQTLYMDGCSLFGAVFEYVSGDILRNLTGQQLYKYMEKIGEITAVLHDHVIQWPGARHLKRFTWDFFDLTGPDARWGDYTRMMTLTPGQRSVYGHAVAVAQKRLEVYGKGPDRYGLIHSDLNINNILVNGDDIYVLDFDDCGFGWFLYDLSTSVLEYFDDVLHDCVEALLKGYERYRPLKKEDREELETFIVLRKIVRVGWIATHWDNDTVRGVKASYYVKTAALAAAYCEKNLELFEMRDEDAV